MDENIISYFFRIGFDANFEEGEAMNLAQEFRKYLINDSFLDKLEKLKHVDYGNDIKLILIEFYVKPTLIELKYLKNEIGNYRKNEKSIGVPIIINDENFFVKSEEDRLIFLKESTFQKLNLLKEVIKRRKLDTNIDLLIMDIEKLI